MNRKFNIVFTGIIFLTLVMDIFLLNLAFCISYSNALIVMPITFGINTCCAIIWVLLRQHLHIFKVKQTHTIQEYAQFYTQQHWNQQQHWFLTGIFYPEYTFLNTYEQIEIKSKSVKQGSSIG